MSGPLGGSAWDAGARRFDLPAVDRVSYGAGALDALADEVRRHGASRVLVVTSPTVRDRTGLLDRVGRALDGLLAAVFADAVAHVPLATVEAAVGMARDARIDLVVSVGGGSAVDCAKAVALAAPYPGEPAAAIAAFDVHAHPAPAGAAALPHIAVTTTLSAAEHTPTFTVTMPGSHVKTMCHHRTVTPATVVLDPTATLETPVWLWAATGARAIDHCVEWYLSRAHMPFTDALVLHALPMLWRSLPAVQADPNDLHARGEGQLAAWMSVFGSANVLGGLSHAIGHQLGSHTGMLHGHTSCVILPRVIEFNASAAPDRVADLARAVGAGDSGDDFVAALRGLLASLSLPSRISEATDAAVDLDAVADATMTEVAIVNNPRTVERDDVRRILEDAR